MSASRSAARATRKPGSPWRRLSAARVAGVLPLERFGHQLGLVTFVTIGHLLSLVLILVVPLYADGVNSRLLQEALRTPPDEIRPRNSVWLRYAASMHGPVSAEEFNATDRYLENSVASVSHLPTEPVSSLVISDKLQLLPADLATDLGTDPIDWLGLGYDDSLIDRIEIVEGRLPEDRGDGGSLEGMLSQVFVNEYGLRVGDRLVLRGGRSLPGIAFDVVLSGIWRPKTPAGSEWPLPVFVYDELFAMPRTAYVDDVAPRLGQRAWYSLLWYARFPREAITVDNATRVRSGLTELHERTQQLLGHRVELQSPAEYLTDYQSRAAALRILLFIFSIPTLLIVFLYIISTGSLFAERQRAEIAVLKGRGASGAQILGAYLFEGALLDIVPLLLGPLAAFGAAMLIGRIESFARLGPANLLPLRLTPATAELAVGVLLASLILGMLPVLVATQQTLISYQQQIVRAIRRPLWQRFYLDLLVLLAAAYGYYTLRRQGALVALGGTGGADPFSNPLSLLLPATALLGCSLLVVRCFPLLAASLVRLGRRILGAPTLLALRHLARAPEQGRGIVLLTTLTLALGSFSASMATTLDRNDADRILYATGGTLRLTEQGVRSLAEERWTFLPEWEHSAVPGIAAWSRVSIGDAALAIGGGSVGGKLVAVDRGGYHLAGWWRSDLASDSLGQLMNVLAAEPQALIVSRSFLAASRLRIGDPVTLAVSQGVPRDFIIRGVVDDFPMVYRQPGQHLFVANFDYVHLVSAPATFELILRLAPGADTAGVVAGLRKQGFDITDEQDARSLIATAKARPERTGFIGLLSLGFVAAAGLTMLSVLLYSLFSFRRRMVEIGVLRAAGLSRRQLAWLLAFELCFLTLTSALAGIVLGVGAARLFVPFYQLGTTAAARTPAFVVVIAWSEIGRLLLILAAMLLVTLAMTTLLLRRLRIHEAIKLGQELG